MLLLVVVSSHALICTFTRRFPSIAYYVGFFDPPAFPILHATAAFGKLLGLLCYRIFLQPTAVGLVFSVLSIPVFGGSVATRIAFARQMPLSFCVTHWIVGITFFLFALSTIMQVR
jgi:hypothetical protein